MQGGAPDELDVVMPEAEVAFRRLPRQGERLRQERVEALAALEVPPAQRGVGLGEVLDGLRAGFQRVGRVDGLRLETPDLAVVVVEQFLNESEHLVKDLSAQAPGRSP